jgi:hypothetical protein
MNMMNAGRWIKRYKKLGNFTIKPWDSRYYALFEGEEMVCVTAYKKGAMEVMKRLTRMIKKCQNCPYNGHS